MKLRFLPILLAAMAITFTACDDTTDTIGSTLTNNVDMLAIDADTFNVTSQTVKANSVLARNTMGYLGRVMDPETQSIVTADFMTQFHTLENYSLPNLKTMTSLDEYGEIIADSCDIRLIYTDFYGDSLAQMKLTAYEMGKSMDHDEYYSDFNPMKEGYIRDGGVQQNRTYTLADLTEKDSIRNLSSYNKNIRIRLNKPYTDKDGKTYNNYGTYILRKYYEEPSNFRNSYKFLHNINPGFFFKMTGGMGSMAYISSSQLDVYFRMNTSDSTKNVVASTSLVGTEEVMMASTFTNDEESIQRMAADNTCTYIKSPAGLYTELDIPVTEIMAGHENDTLNTAKIELKRLNNETQSGYQIDIPQHLLIIPATDEKSFFADNKVPDYKTAFVATYSSVTNSYVFSNVSGLVSSMWHNYKSGKYTASDWNKALVIPITITYNTTSSGTSTITKTSHDMSMSSTRLVGGSANPNEPIKISVIYSKFNGR